MRRKKDVGDDPFRNDPVLAVIEQERQELVAQMKSKRWEAVIDACFGAAGASASVLFLYAPWAPPLEILHVEWVPYPVAAILGTFGAWNAIMAITAHHWLLRLA